MKHDPVAPTHVTPAPVEETHLIHEEEPTILARWLQQGLEQGPVFWGLVALGVGTIFGLLLLFNYLTLPKAGEQEAWAQLASLGQDPAASIFGPTPTSEVPQQLQDLALEYPNTPAAQWAQVQAASILLKESSTALATSARADAIGKLLEAGELFDQVSASAKEPTLKRVSSFGAARATEARLGLPLEDTKRPKPSEVVAQYQKVAEQFPDTPEGQEATRLAERLQDPISVAFYEQLAKFKPEDLAIPPSSSDPAGLPGSGLPGLNLGPGQGKSILDILQNAPGGTSPGAAPSPADILPPALSPDAPVSPPADTPAPEVTPPAAPESTPAPEVTPPAAPESAPAPAPEGGEAPK